MIIIATNKDLNKNMKIGEVCNFKNGKALTSSNFVDGIYPVIGSGKMPIGYHNEYNMNENSKNIKKIINLFTDLGYLKN